MVESQESEAFALADAQFATCQRVEQFVVASVRPILNRAAEPTPEHDTYIGAVLRVQAWLRSLAKLNHPGDFQAVLAASRAIFEIAVDLTLLHRDSTLSSAMLLAWEDSAKLASAERLKRFCDARPNFKPPAGGAEILAYLSQSDRVRAVRARYWGNENHPMRWTGRNLARDAEEADRLNPSGFAEYYSARYPQVCWNVHGSGLAGVRRISEELFPGLTVFGFAESAEFSLVAAREALHLVERWDAVSEARFDDLRNELAQIRVHVWASHHQGKK